MQRSMVEREVVTCHDIRKPGQARAGSIRPRLPFVYLSPPTVYAKMT